MIAPKTVTEIGRLLNEGRLSQRKIARLMGVSRGSVGAIALGKRPERQTPQPMEDDEPTGPPQRCPGCGGLVYLPCRLCRQRARLAQKSEPASRRGSFRSEETSGFNLRPEHQIRYQEVRRWRRENQGQPMEGRTAS